MAPWVGSTSEMKNAQASMAFCLTGQDDHVREVVQAVA